jgi:hypothetical protein
MMDGKLKWTVTMTDEEKRVLVNTLEVLGGPVTARMMRRLVEIPDGVGTERAVDEGERKPSSEIEFHLTERGVLEGMFIDKYDNLCSIQESSAASEPCLWLGLDKYRMHLTRRMAAALLVPLVQFVVSGEISVCNSRPAGEGKNEGSDKVDREFNSAFDRWHG